MVSSERKQPQGTSLVTGSSLMWETTLVLVCFHLLFEFDRIVIKVLGWRQYAVNKNVLYGLVQAQLRLLQKLGYEVLVVGDALCFSVELFSLLFDRKFSSNSCNTGDPTSKQ